MATPPPYDADAQDAMMSGQLLTGEHRIAQFEPEALVAGLLDAPGGEAARVLRALAIDPAAVRLDAERALGQLPTLQYGTEVSIASNRLRNVLARAEAEAARIGNGTVGAGHLLLGVLVAGDSVIARDLARSGATPDGVRRVLASAHESARSAASPAPASGDDAEDAALVPLLDDVPVGATGEAAGNLADEADALLGDLLRATRAAVAIVAADLEPGPMGDAASSRAQAAAAWLDRAPVLLETVARLRGAPGRHR